MHSTNTLERLNKEVKQRVDVVGIFPNEESIMRLRHCCKDIDELAFRVI
ncbi:transposase, Mutator family protein, partial [Candidatus Erwinia dacicola]